ncbi:Phosphate-binding protein PstS precursor [Rosistilla carotiformis]|uniref:Phosphate-binding protein n=1 Tax=Rosistilla carotiformis TaxID=2528017 RepID=A0A518JYB5_9BACT|nr:phosphate ABC transporter substrate-binding protein PstS [Rosistilla carotiformis]QDV70538.1 Phosphate-binding protein PstS precursor [Rosistilla carotiformis]
MRWRNTSVFVAGLAVCLLVTGCSSSSTNSDSGSGDGSTTTGSVKLTGSGASFPFPLYDRWFKEFSRANDGVKVDYQAKGSGAGIKDFTNGTVDFGASDAAMSDEEIAAVSQGVQLLPMTAGEVVLAYNLPGVSELKLSRDAYIGIFLGKVTNWTDPAIVEANPGVKLPDQDITVVRRADSSGTTYVFTQHLSAISEDWANGPGTGKTVVWPSSDKFVASPKNDGVTATITQTPGAIGYIEYGYAKLTKLAMASLQNKAGNFVLPSLESGQAALSNVEMPADLRAWLPDPPGEQAFPIVSYTWLLCYKKYDDPQKAEVLKSMVKYCLTEGQKVSDEMGYVPLPADVVEKVTAALDSIQ